jgi:hypothetical protein
MEVAQRVEEILIVKAGSQVFTSLLDLGCTFDCPQQITLDLELLPLQVGFRPILLMRK